MSYVDEILQKDEEVVAKAKVTKLSLIGVWVKGVLLCWLFLIPTIKAIKQTIVVSKIELALTNQRLVGRVGVVGRQIMDSKLDKVQTVQIRETFWGRIFGYANIAVSTAGTGGSEYVYIGIARAQEFKQKIMSQIDEYEEFKVRKQAEALASAMKN